MSKKNNDAKISDNPSTKEMKEAMSFVECWFSNRSAPNGTKLRHLIASTTAVATRGNLTAYQATVAKAGGAETSIIAAPRAFAISRAIDPAPKRLTPR